MDKVLNGVLTNALVDAWQSESNRPISPAQVEPENKFHQNGIQVSLTTAVEACLVNMGVTRIGKPDYVPLTTNIGFKNERANALFPIGSFRTNIRWPYRHGSFI